MRKVILTLYPEQLKNIGTHVDELEGKIGKSIGTGRVDKPPLLTTARTTGKKTSTEETLAAE